MLPLLSGNGFFINTALNMVSVHTSLWAYLLLALGKSSNAQVQATLSSVQLLQLGTLSVLVYLFTLGLEIGLLRALWTIIRHCRVRRSGRQPESGCAVRLGALCHCVFATRPRMDICPQACSTVEDRPRKEQLGTG